MDYTAAVSDARLEDHLADRMRLDAFRLGRSNSYSNVNLVQKSSHARSHSRSHSLSVPTLVPSVYPPLASNMATPDSPPASPPLSMANSKRNSHHRRQSSVSTRRESAEIMGVSLPAVPASVTEDNINFGDKDSIRRRALWTLEGKTDVGAFSKVEIPELDSAQMEKRFEFPTKPSYPPGIGAGYGSGLSGLAGGKRDSFGRFSVPCTSKEQLHTLLEEEEEDEEDDGENCVEDDATQPESPQAEPASPVEVTITTPSPAPFRQRPAGLRLRPLSLAAGSVVQATNGDLPTLLPTSNPRPRPGLKSLTLTASSSDSFSSDSSDGFSSSAWRGQSLILSGSSETGALIRRSSLLEGPTVSALNRRSSISYIPANVATGLPTPEMTPTSDRRCSIDSAGSDSSRSSRGSRTHSSSEHHFLYQAHAALVRRISDLERALSARPQSRPLSYASDVSIPSAEPPSDEMLQLVADLKAERDELKKDVDGWRTRVSDCERQTTLLMNRIEAERREAWVARERVGMLEVEKRSLEAMLKEKVLWGEEGWRKLEDVEKQLGEAREECKNLRAGLQRCTDVEDECIRLRACLLEERKRTEDLEKELDGVLATPTPTAFRMAAPPAVSRTMAFAKRGGLGFRSTDSIGSSTDVESLDDSFDRHESSLKVVQEEDEDEHYDATSDCTEEDELARYEDEDENDSYAFQTSLSDSSFESTDDIPRGTSHLLDMSVDDIPGLTITRSNTVSPVPASPPQLHERHKSLSRAWSFPANEQPIVVAREPEEIDRFFGCLDDIDNSPPLGSNLSSVESGKNLFSRALAEADDDDELPFVIPSDVGVEVSESRTILDVVVEEDEDATEAGANDEDDDKPKPLGPNDEFIREEVEGGIIFTFSPPTLDEEPIKTHPEDISSSDGHDSYDFCQPQAGEEDRSAVSLASELGTSPSQSLSRIPPPRTFVSSIPIPASSTPVKANSVSFPRTSTSPGAFYTPPPKRVSTSSIPLPRSQSEPPASTPTKTQLPSFIPQPRRKLAPTTTAITTPTKAHSKPRMSMLHDQDTAEPVDSSPEMKTGLPVEAATSSPCESLFPFSPMSPTMAARLSLQKLTNLIPIPSMPWSSPILGSAASAAAACLVPSSSSDSVIAEDTSSDRSSAVTSQAQVRKYVPREQQLEKLRARLEEEQRSTRIYTAQNL